MHMSSEVQKALLAVGTGLALILSIIALVVSINADRGNHDGGRMFGGAQHGQIGGGSGQGGQQGRGFGGPGQGGQRPPMMAPGGAQDAPSTGTQSTPNQSDQ